MTENLFWIIYVYLVTPVGYCAAAGAFRRRWRGAALGALVGLPTMVVGIAVGLLLSEATLSPLNFFLAAQAPAVAGAFVAGWSTRLLPDDEDGGGG